MKAAAKVYKSCAGVLSFVDSGDCEMYCPTIDKPSKYVPPHVTISIGDFRVHIDKDAFLRFCTHILYNDRGKKDGIPVLR